MENPWSVKQRKRQAAVDHIKSTPEYISYLESKAETIEVPDSSDATISKRKWEASIMVWRRQLRSDFERKKIPVNIDGGVNGT